jgi:carbonic anhydrase
MMALGVACMALATGWADAVQPTPEQALMRLMDGNKRFVAEEPIHTYDSSVRRKEFEKGQRPFAAILGCSDARVPPEIVFDQGLGDLFTVRVAGNVAGPVEIDSLDFSVLQVGVPLIVVMGHQDCGAIKAVMAGKTQEIEAVANLISPCILKTSNLEEAIQFNAEIVVAGLKANPTMADLIRKKKLMIVGAYYNFRSGKVDFFLPDAN